MKTVVIIASILAVTTMVYSLNEQRQHKFYDNLKKYSVEHNISLSAPTAEAYAYALRGDSKVIKENGELLKEDAIDGLVDFISDAGKLKEAQELYVMCFDEVVKSGITGWVQTVHICRCCLPILSLLDKP